MPITISYPEQAGNGGCDGNLSEAVTVCLKRARCFPSAPKRVNLRKSANRAKSPVLLGFFGSGRGAAWSARLFWVQERADLQARRKPYQKPPVSSACALSVSERAWTEPLPANCWLRREIVPCCQA